MNRLVTTLAIAVMASAVAVAAAPASAAAGNDPYLKLYQDPVTLWHSGTMAGSRWMIKGNDLAEFPVGYGRWSWVMCGQTVEYGMASIRGTHPRDGWGACAPGQIPAYANVSRLLTYLKGSHPDGNVVVLDPETWAWTPGWERAHQAKWIKIAGETAKRHGCKLIVTPQGPANQLAAMYAAGARYCWIVEDQAQFTERQFGGFRSDVRSFLRIVRRYHHARAMIGLATNAGGIPATAGVYGALPAVPASSHELYRDYIWASTTMHVRLFWMNADAWLEPGGIRGNGQDDGTGDPGVAERFFGLLGLPRPAPS